MKKLKNILTDDNAEIMLESTIVIIITLFVLIAMISLGFLFYQQAMLNTVASEIAKDLGTSYKLAGTDIGSDVTNPSLYHNLRFFRTTALRVGDMKKDQKKNADDYLPGRVKLSSLGIYDKQPWIDNFDIIIDNVGRLHVEITVKMECSFLFDGALKYFGIIKQQPTFSATARAECIDITSYASYINFVRYLGNDVDYGMIGDIADIFLSANNLLHTPGKVNDAYADVLEEYEEYKKNNS